MEIVPEKRSWLDRPLFSFFPKLTIEIAIFGFVILLAVLSRFYNLGERVISHDESLHTYFSWLLYNGSGYEHNPMMHGPFQFHLLALTYFLFGVNDFTARLPHAIASILTILVLWNWRRYLGRPGTLVAAALMVISPYLLFYGRYARNEAFVGLFGVLTLYAIMRYEETGRPRFLYLLTAATVLHFATKETAFIYTAQALLFLAIYFISRVTRRSWRSLKTYNAFIALLGIGLLLLGAVIGYGAYTRDTSAATTSAETLTPLVPGQTPIFVGIGGFHLSITTILVIAAVLTFLVAAILLIISYGWKQIRAERSFDMLILLGTLVLPQLVAFPIKLLGWDPLDYTFTWPGWDINALLQIGMVRTGIALVIIGGISIAIGIWWNKKLWLKNAAIWYVIFTVLYTTVFTNGQGFFTGTIGSLGYWLVQQGVARGGQPWYYYIFLQIPLYEFLPFLGFCLAIFFGLRRRFPNPLPSPAVEVNTNPEISDLENPDQDDKRGLPFGLLIWWSFSSLLAYSIAGEKMPWLTYHITLPMILLSGWVIGQIIERIDWEQLRHQRAGLVIASTAIFITGLFSTLLTSLGANPPFGGKDLSHLQSTATFLFSAIATIGSLAALIYLLKGWNLKNFFRLGALITFSLLAVLTVRAAYRASYIEYDNGTEYLVYAHGARGIKDVMEQVEEISKRTTNGMDLVIAYDVSAPDTGVSWPFTWYLRDYTQLRPFDQPSRSLRDAPIIIVDQKNFSKIEPVVGQAYYQFNYIRMVWPNMDYFGLTWERIWNAITDPKLRAGILDIWFNRDYALYAEATGSEYFTLPSWEPSDKMRLYIRKDIAALIWNYGVESSTQIQADPYENGYIPLMADIIFGDTGQADGQFSAPRGIAVGPDGSIYVADSRNHRIQHISAEGTLIKSWGTYAEASSMNAPGGTFNEPWDVAISPDGKWIYVADTWNHRIQKFSADGDPIKTWGTAIYGSTDSYGVWGPRGIAVDSLGRVLVVDTGNKRIVVYDADGNYLTQFGGAGMELGQFDEPVGIAIDGNGIVYVADTWNQRIQTFTQGSDGLTYVPLAQWEIFGWYGQSLDNKPFLTVDNQGHVFVTDPEAYRVLEFDSQGNFIRTWGDSGSGTGNFGLAAGIAVDSLGHVWVSDAGNNRLMRFTLPVSEPTEPGVPTQEPSTSSPATYSLVPDVCRVTAGAPDWLTMRVCAEISCSPVTLLQEGTYLNIISSLSADNWLAVQSEDYIGWISAEYCK